MIATPPAELGKPLVTAHRSLRGLLVSGASIVIICGGLAGWNLAIRGGTMGRIGVGFAVLIGAFLVGLTLRSAKALMVCEGGLRLERFLGAGRTVKCGQVESARVYRAPLGKKPVVVTIRVSGQAAISAGEAEFDNVPKLIEVLGERAGDRLVDDRS